MEFYPSARKWGLQEMHESGTHYNKEPKLEPMSFVRFQMCVRVSTMYESDYGGDYETRKKIMREVKRAYRKIGGIIKHMWYKHGRTHWGLEKGKPRKESREGGINLNNVLKLHHTICCLYSSLIRKEDRLGCESNSFLKVTCAKCLLHEDLNLYIRWRQQNQTQYHAI